MAPDASHSVSRTASPWLKRRFSSANVTPSSLSPSLPPAAGPSSLASSTASSLSSPRSFSPIHPEPDRRGNLEYKLRILPVSASRFSRLVTQLKWRLAEGGGLAVYEIGVLDDGTLVGLPREEMQSSLAQLAMMGSALGADLEVRRCIVVEREASSSTTPEANHRSPSRAESVHYRHKIGSSSKNTSAGLDNIVGLRSLNNEEAARMIGTDKTDVKGATFGWTFQIAPDDLLSAEDESFTSDGGEQNLDSTTETEDEEDGFAFPLTLDDEEDDDLPASSGSWPRNPIVPSDPGPDSPSSPWAAPSIPTDVQQCLSRQPLPCFAEATDVPADSTQLTDLSGMDVKGLLHFNLTRTAAPLPPPRPPKKWSGRRNRREQDGGQASSMSPGDAEEAREAASNRQARQEAEAALARQSQLRKAAKPPKVQLRGPRMQRRMRRLAELKAREREGQGTLLALAAVTGSPLSALVQEKLKWWRYSGLSLEQDVPYYNATRQAWVREVVDWLTVEEVKQLSDSWGPKIDYSEVDDDGSDGEEQVVPVASVTTAQPISSTSARRKRAQQRKRLERDAHKAPPYRPEFVMAVPSKKGMPARSDYGHHSSSSPSSPDLLASTAGTSSVDVALNIDDDLNGTQLHTEAVASSGHEPPSPSTSRDWGSQASSPSGASTITEMGTSGGSMATRLAQLVVSPPRLQEQSDAVAREEGIEHQGQHVSNGDKKTRLIIEAVLTLRDLASKGKRAAPSQETGGSPGHSVDGEDSGNDDFPIPLDCEWV